MRRVLRRRERMHLLQTARSLTTRQGVFFTPPAPMRPVLEPATDTSSYKHQDLVVLCTCTR